MKFSAHTHTQAPRLSEGTFVRGIDCTGASCSGVVVFDIVSVCMHSEVACLIDGVRKLVHVSADAVSVVTNENLSSEELVFAQREREHISHRPALLHGLRGCPQGIAMLLAALN